jgi:hypothetical protein
MMSASGQTEPSCFVFGAAELASIADTGECEPRSRRRAPGEDRRTPVTGRHSRRPASPRWARPRRKHLQQNHGAVWRSSYSKASERGSMNL